MNEHPKGSLLGKAFALIRQLGTLQLPFHSAHTGYFMVLSAFPSLLLALSLLSRTSLPVEQLLEVLEAVLPEALMTGAEKLVRSAWNHPSGLVLGLSAVTALWSASRGVHALLAGMNAVYGVTETRGYFRKRILSMVYTLAFFLLLPVTLTVQVFGDALAERLARWDHPLVTVLTRVIDLRFLPLLGAQSLVFAAMYMLLPSRRSSFSESLPGAMAAGLGWLAFSDLFSLYVARGGRYTAVYGSIYGVALAMVWLYCCLHILFLGGCLNVWLAGKRKGDRDR